MDSITSFLGSVWPHMLDLVVAYVLALVIGWNRERATRSAGLRTFPLVAVASCGFMLSVEGISEQDTEATARVLTGVATGIGFIGAGAIMKSGEQVHGTATAAAIWATGAIGAAVALGAYHIAVAIAVFTAGTLYLLTPLKPHAPDDGA